MEASVDDALLPKVHRFVGLTRLGAVPFWETSLQHSRERGRGPGSPYNGVGRRMKEFRRNFRVGGRRLKNCVTSVQGKLLVSAMDGGDDSHSDGGDLPACQS